MFKVTRFDGKVVGTFSSMDEVNAFWVVNFGFAFCHATGYTVAKA